MLTRSKAISARLYPTTKFAAELYARLDRRSIASWLEDAIDQKVKADQKRFGIDWRDFDDPEPGVSECLMLLSDIRVDEDEDLAARFILQHKPFFMSKDAAGKWKPDRKKIAVLWEQLEHYAQRWVETRKEDMWAIGREMAKALKEAGITPPKWGAGAEVE